MTDFPASHADLLNAPVASLATIGTDGFPQVTALWFVHEDGELLLSLNETRRKTRNLVARPECSLMILDLANPMRYLEVRARAHIEPDSDYSLVAKVKDKYGADVRQNDRPGERRMRVRLEPVNVYAVDLSG